MVRGGGLALHAFTRSACTRYTPLKCWAAFSRQSRIRGFGRKTREFSIPAVSLVFTDLNGF
ncbi:MAG: hypothetical protein A2428_00365 [Bdellovibrionales bacterium RIFOXYC1_FULL_54_43]|nr:MAG: hypothetical protein A2428_00365 [Bdellovibrionales bacterium RIFOXYC1_FULL_54_43]